MHSQWCCVAFVCAYQAILMKGHTPCYTFGVTEVLDFFFVTVTIRFSKRPTNLWEPKKKYCHHRHRDTTTAQESGSRSNSVYIWTLYNKYRKINLNQGSLMHTDPKICASSMIAVSLPNRHFFFSHTKNRNASEIINHTANTKHTLQDTHQWTAKAGTAQKKTFACKHTHTG